MPWRAQINRLPLEIDHRPAHHLFGRKGDHPLDQVHHPIIVNVRGIELELCELGVVLKADPLVAKVAADLVHAIVHPHQQALQVELKADPQVQILVQLVVVGHKRPRRRAAINGLEDRRLDLQKSLLVHEPPQRTDRPGPGTKDLAHLGIRCQVGVPLPIALLDVAKGRVAHHLALDLLLFDHRQGAERLGQHPIALHQHRGLTRPRDHQGAGRLDKVAQIVIALQLLDRRAADLVGPQKELDPAAAVLKVGKRNLAHRAYTAETAADGHPCRVLIRTGRCEDLMGLGDGMGPMGAAWIGVDSLLAEARQLFQPLQLKIGRFPRHADLLAKKKPPQGGQETRRRGTSVAMTGFEPVTYGL